MHWQRNVTLLLGEWSSPTDPAAKVADSYNGGSPSSRRHVEFATVRSLSEWEVGSDARLLPSPHMLPRLVPSPLMLPRLVRASEWMVAFVYPRPSITVA